MLLSTYLQSTPEGPRISSLIKCLISPRAEQESFSVHSSDKWKAYWRRVEGTSLRFHWLSAGIFPLPQAMAPGCPFKTCLLLCLPIFLPDVYLDEIFHLLFLVLHRWWSFSWFSFGLQVISLMIGTLTLWVTEDPCWHEIKLIYVCLGFLKKIKMPVPSLHTSLPQGVWHLCWCWSVADSCPFWLFTFSCESFPHLWLGSLI